MEKKHNKGLDNNQYFQKKQTTSNEIPLRKSWRWFITLSAATTLLLVLMFHLFLGKSFLFFSKLWGNFTGATATVAIFYTGPLSELPSTHKQLFVGIHKFDAGTPQAKENSEMPLLAMPPTSFDSSGQHTRMPVILIPPLAGTRLFAELNNKTDTPHYYCSTTSERYLIWVDPWQLLPYLIDCWLDNMRLIYHPSNQTCSSPPGVKVYPGNTTDAVMVVIKYLPESTMVYGELVNMLRSKGWEEEKDLIGFPIDWRLAVDTFSRPKNVFDRLKGLVEEKVQVTGRKAVVVSMSMGSTLFSVFLQRQSEEWKTKYIDSFISLSGVFGGAPTALLYLLSAMNWIPVIKIDPVKFHQLVRSFPSIAWLTPREELYGNVSIAQVGKRHFTAKMIPDLLRIAGANISAELWALSHNYSAMTPPNVPVHCIYSVDLPTAVHVQFSSTDFNDVGAANVTYGDGDGVVPEASLKVCADWKGRQKEIVKEKRLSRVSHADIVKDSATLNYIVNVIINATLFYDM